MSIFIYYIIRGQWVIQSDIKIRFNISINTLQGPYSLFRLETQQMNKKCVRP